MSDEALTEAIAAKYQEIEIEKEEKLKAAQLSKQAAAKAQNGNQQQNNNSREHSLSNGHTTEKALVQAQIEPAMN